MNKNNNIKTDNYMKKTENLSSSKDVLNDNKLQDERFQVAEESICSAFFILIKENEDMEKITVSQVIKKAGIGRTTFYNHYESIPHLIKCLEERTLNDMFGYMENARLKSDRGLCMAYFENICRYTRKNPFFANLIKGNNCDELFEKTIFKLHGYVNDLTQKSEKTSEDDKEMYAYMVAGTIGLVIGILHKWIRDGMVVEDEQIALMLTNTFFKGILPYM